jgi:N-methylhydantoinase A
VEKIRNLYDELERRSTTAADGDPAIRRSVDIRYEGQLASLNVGVPDDRISENTVNEIVDSFHEEYEAIYGHANRDEPVEAIVWRLRTIEETPGIKYNEDAPGGTVDEAIKHTRSVYIGNEFEEVPVFSRYDLPQGENFEGPALVEESESTLVVGPNGSAHVDDVGNIVIEMGDT